MYEIPVPLVEDLITRTTVTAQRIRDMPGIFEKVRNSLQRRYGDQEVSLHFRADIFKPRKRVTFTFQPPHIGRCSTLAPGIPDRSPTPLVRGHNHSTRLISSTKRHRAHQIEATT
ncbi:hypothetical protein TNCV_2411451 [Trichonephila clavipes]|nr:hypothetical protein TNCV_2411451 [Trichonephila clavipes]